MVPVAPGKEEPDSESDAEKDAALNSLLRKSTKAPRKIKDGQYGGENR